MNKEIERIKSKDYSDIDQRLFSTLHSSNNIDSTISSLAEFQNFLKQQISKVQNSEDRESLLKASHVLFNKPEKSCCNCREKVMQLHHQIIKLKRYLKHSREGVMREVKSCISEVSIDIEEAINEHRKKSEKALEQNFYLKAMSKQQSQEIEKLKTQKQKLQTICDEWEKAKKRRRQRSSLDYSCLPSKYQQFQSVQSAPINLKTQCSNITPRMPRPLRQRNGQRSTEYIYTKKSQSKENNILKLKGAQMHECRKSVKKLKLFSLL